MKKPRGRRDQAGRKGDGSDIAAIRCRPMAIRFAVLGLQQVGKGFQARCFIPGAETVTAIR
jgi:1,4-alpha-glucan branching enzyme